MARHAKMERVGAGIFKLLWSPGIDSRVSIPPAYVAWRAGTTTPIPTRFLAPTDCLKISARDIQGMKAAASSGETESMEAVVAAEQAAEMDTARPSTLGSTEAGITAADTVGAAAMTAGTICIPLKEGWN
jgi:hypothetical protein